MSRKLTLVATATVAFAHLGLGAAAEDATTRIDIAERVVGNPPGAGGTAILALDMYEHSYHIDFGAKAGSHVETFINAIRWSNAERLWSI